MSTRTLWQDLFGISVEGSLTSGTFSTGEGVTSTKTLLPLTESAFFKPSSGYFEYNQTTGKAYRTFQEYTQTYQGEPVEYTFGVQANAHTLSLVQSLFFQGGCTQAAGDADSSYKFTSVPYTSADPSYYAYFMRWLQETVDSDPIDELVEGGVCNTFTLSGEKGGLITLEVGMQGANFIQGDYSAHQTIEVDAGFDTLAPLKFQNMTATIADAGGEGAAIQVPSFSITVSETPTWSFYNDTQASNVALGPIEVNGSISFPWSDSNYGTDSSITDFMNGQDKEVILSWGDTDATGYVYVKLNCFITDYTIGGDNELVVEATLTGVASSDGSTPPITIITQYDSATLSRA